MGGSSLLDCIYVYVLYCTSWYLYIYEIATPVLGVEQFPKPFVLHDIRLGYDVFRCPRRLHRRAGPCRSRGCPGRCSCLASQPLAIW
jgi:hypothetical protein